MATLNKIEIDLIGIGKAFMMNKRLTVPTFQRSFAWEEKHINDFFSDLENAIEQDEPEYFLGSIVTTKNVSDFPEVVDGQQRLATTMILLAAIRDYYLSLGDKERATHIAATYLYDNDLVTLEKKPRLHLNDSDNEFFSKRILSESKSADHSFRPTKDSHHKILRAAELAKEQIARITKSSNAIQYLADWVDYIRDSLKIIWVKAPDEANAFVIFETLNDRGLTLAISDLLKNYLFGLAGDRITEVQQRWTTMVGILEAAGDEDIAVTYIRHLWASRYGLVREKDLYSDIKNKIKTKIKALDFASELADTAKLYVAMLNPSHELWEKYGDTARKYIETLNLLRMIQIRPLVLSVLKEFNARETEKSLRLMVSWCVRFLIYGGLGGGTLETNYSQSGKEIREGKIKTTSELSNKLKNIVPSDAAFKEAFLTAAVSKNYLARYYLRALENQLRGEDHPELIPNENAEIVNLEHILPLNPSNLWKHIKDDDREAYVKRIGNLTLLSKKINIDAGNDSFNYKKTFYKKSKFNISSQICKCENWDVVDIKKRQKKLSELALKAWPLK